MRINVWRKGYSHDIPLVSPDLRSSNFCRPLILLFVLEKRHSMFIILALICALSALPWALALCGPINEVTLSFFGSPGVLPSGSDTAFDCGRGTSADGKPGTGGTEFCLLGPLATSNDIPTDRQWNLRRSNLLRNGH